jgi:hypothetical protein
MNHATIPIYLHHRHVDIGCDLDGVLPKKWGFVPFCTMIVITSITMVMMNKYLTSNNNCRINGDDGEDDGVVFVTNIKIQHFGYFLCRLTVWSTFCMEMEKTVQLITVMEALQTTKAIPVEALLRMKSSSMLPEEKANYPLNSSIYQAYPNALCLIPGHSISI